jgi:hypothetical protein
MPVTVQKPTKASIKVMPDESGYSDLEMVIGKEYTKVTLNGFVPGNFVSQSVSSLTFETEDIRQFAEDLVRLVRSL